MSASQGTTTSISARNFSRLVCFLAEVCDHVTILAWAVLAFQTLLSS